MTIFNRYINHQSIIRLLLVFAFAGAISIFLLVNRMNALLNAEVGFDKDSIYTIITHESTGILPDSMVFSSDLPGFNKNKSVELDSEYLKNSVELSLQFISSTYFEFFNYEVISERRKLLKKESYLQKVYLNESAAKKLGINNLDDAPGTIVTSDYSQYIVCGIVEDKFSLCVKEKEQAVVYQLTNEHLANAFIDISKINDKEFESLKGLCTPISFQSRLQENYRFIEDLSYSIFLFLNIMILLIALGYIGSKYSKKEKAFYTILSVGIHVITIIISKTYMYMIALLGLVAGPLSLLLHKFWLGIYENKVNFGTLDLFIFLSIATLTIYIVCCPKNKIKEQLWGKSINVNSI